TLWPNRATAPEDAAAPPLLTGPLKTTALINGNIKTVLRFDGKELLEVRHSVPPTGSLFLVFRTAETATPGRRLVGWEDADVGRHGLGLMLNASGGLHAIVRNDGNNGDVVHTRAGAAGFEIVSLTWGSRGVTLYR